MWAHRNAYMHNELGGPTLQWMFKQALSSCMLYSAALAPNGPVRSSNLAQTHRFSQLNTCCGTWIDALAEV